jgi:hypothetical protein
MARFHLRNGIRTQFTAAEEIARDAEETQALLDAQAEKVAEDARQANRASTKAKLEALGLTTDEIKDTFNI